jgi:hypothetical protein
LNIEEAKSENQTASEMTTGRAKAKATAKATARATAKATAKADPYGMTNKRTGKGKSKDGS